MKIQNRKIEKINFVKIYFRLPFTGYFIGKEDGKFYFYHKEFDAITGIYFFTRI